MSRLTLVAILAALALLLPATADASELAQRHGHGARGGHHPVGHHGIGVRHPIWAPGGIAFGVPFPLPPIVALPPPVIVPVSVAVPVPVAAPVPVAVPQPVAVPYAPPQVNYAPALPVAAPSCGCPQ